MKKIRNWFIGDYLAKTPNIFERARIEMIYSYAIIFIFLGLLFYGNLLANRLWYHFYIITVGILSLVTIPFILKYKQNYRLAAGVYLAQQFFVSASEIILQGAPLDIASFLFTTIVVLFALMVYGKRQGIYISLPFIALIAVEIINKSYDEKLVYFDVFKDQRLPEQPVFILMPLALNIFVIRKLIATRDLAEAQLHEQKMEIEMKNKEILDSMNYARRIQRSLLPTDIYLQRVLNKEDKK
jgi:hypothetical protein